MVVGIGASVSPSSRFSLSRLLSDREERPDACPQSDNGLLVYGAAVVVVVVVVVVGAAVGTETCPKFKSILRASSLLFSSSIFFPIALESCPNGATVGGTSPPVDEACWTAVCEVFVVPGS